MLLQEEVTCRARCHSRRKSWREEVRRDGSSLKFCSFLPHALRVHSPLPTPQPGPFLHLRPAQPPLRHRPVMSSLPVASSQEQVLGPHGPCPIRVGRASPAHWRRGRRQAKWHLGVVPGAGDPESAQEGGLGRVPSRRPAEWSRALPGACRQVFAHPRQRTQFIH